jgi:serine phosphatase RsbU (regulator of sigma subunit)/ligand-binding sensor domain-containing protein
VKPLFTLLTVLFCCSLWAQNTNHFIRNYSYDEFNGHSQIFSIAEDNRGLIYISNGTTQGVIEYDGLSWRKSPTIKRSFVSSIKADRNGRIYVGARGEFGYMSPDSLGSMRFVSMSKDLAEEDQEFSYIWYTHVTPFGVVFQSNGKIFICNEGKIKVINPIGDRFHTSFYEDGKLYVNQTGVGLTVYNGTELELAKNGARFDDFSVYSISKHDESSYLISTMEGGLKLYYPDRSEEDCLEDFPMERRQYLINSRLGPATRLSNGDLALCTSSIGVVILNADGKIKELINTEAGLITDAVYTCFVDSRDNLWVGSNLGVSRIEYNSAVTFLSSDGQNSISGVNAFRRMNGKMYVASQYGVSYFDNGEGEEALKAGNKTVEILNKNTHCFEDFAGKVLVGSDQGVFDITNSEAIEIDNRFSKGMVVSSKDSTVMFVCGKTGVYYIKDNGRELETSPIIEGTEDDMINILENTRFDGGTELWLGTFGKTVLRLTFTDDLNRPKIERFDSLNSGLPSLEINIAMLGGEVVFGTGYGLYRFDREESRFYYDSTFNKPYKNGSTEVFRMLDDKANGLIWKFTANQIAYYKGGSVAKEITWNELPHSSVPGFYGVGSIECVYAEEGAMWLGCKQGILRIDLNSEKDYNHIYPTLIRGFTVNDSLMFNGTFFDAENNALIEQPEKSRPTLSFNQNSLRFDFAAPYYEAEEDLIYSYKLQGFNDEWSRWTDVKFKEYTNLDPGEYTFMVKARNYYGVESSVAIYKFTITPPPTPWYYSWWAYLSYVVLFLLFIWGLLILNGKRLKAANEKLQRIVTERTAEIMLQKEEIELQRDEITEKNSAITSSIQYAKRLQDAILPEEDLIGQSLNVHFVYWQPRDIVSGDFYWYHEKEDKIFFAAADCTGHGVPGAFVSMTCHNIMNQVIIDLDNDDPGVILSKVHQGVVKVFQKEGALARAQDGMDIAFCVLNKSTGKLEFAGAHNPLVLVRNGEITELKADRTPIGGRTPLDHEFVRKELETESGDWVYLYSDGYPDQFGGDAGRKFMSKNFKKMLAEISVHPPHTQQQQLNERLNQWQGNYKRIDDILVVGFQIQ